MAEAVRRQNFELDKSVGLKDIDIQSQQLKADRSKGLRDIGQGRERGVESVVNNALQRGIYRSGIRKEGVEEVNVLADQASGDLRGDIDRALARLSNQRRGVAGKQFVGAEGSGMDAFFSEMLRLINEMGNFIEFEPPDIDYGEGIESPPTMDPRRPSVF